MDMKKNVDNSLLNILHLRKIVEHFHTDEVHLIILNKDNNPFIDFGLGTMGNDGMLHYQNKTIELKTYRFNKFGEKYALWVENAVCTSDVDIKYNPLIEADVLDRYGKIKLLDEFIEVNMTQFIFGLALGGVCGFMMYGFFELVAMVM